MANIANAEIIQTANTFDHWRIRDNLSANDVNEIARGNFNKVSGNVEISAGYLLLSKTSGVTLTVDTDARISGNLSVKNFTQDAAANFASDAVNVAFRSVTGNVYANGNTYTRFLYNNTFISAANINASGFIETTGVGSNNANLIMNVGGVLTVRTLANSSNVAILGNLSVSNIATIGNGRFTLANTTTANVLTLHANTTGATANFANVYAANTNTVNANVTFLNVATRANVVLANILTANVLTLNTSTLEVTTQANSLSSNIITANVATLNVNAVGASANIRTANIANLATANIVATAIGTGTLNVTTGNVTSLFVTTLTVTDPISAPSESASELYRLRVGLSPRGVGTFGVFQGTSNGNAAIRFNTTGNVWQTTANDLTTYATVITTANVQTSYSTDSANAASLTAVKGANDNALAAFASSNNAANTVRVSQNTGSTIVAANGVNFNNTATVLCTVGAGINGNANVSFTTTAAVQGAAGSTGSQGTTGTSGTQGTTGTAGTQGATGTQGASGSNGTQGASGSNGTQGASGSNGTQGASGSNGAQGTSGSNGTQGASGSNGTQGATGGTGGTGTQGTTGGTGGTGTQGATGGTGGTGTQGATGPSTAINATNYSTGSYYPVMVAFYGSNYTPYIAYSTYYYNGGTVYATDFAATSDARLKNVLGFVDNATDIVQQLNAIRYTWNPLAASLGYTSKHALELGVLAQEVQAVVPEAVTEDDAGYLRVSYDRLVPVLIEAVKELSARIKILEEK